MIRARPVAARASRTAAIVASVPELTRRTISMDGTRRAIASAMSTSSAVGAPNASPDASCRSIAAITAGGRWPRIIGPQAPT